MLTYKIYEHHQRNGKSFFTAYLVETINCRFLWRKWSEVEEYGVTRCGSTMPNDWTGAKFDSIEEARESCAKNAAHKQKLADEYVVRVELVATDTLKGV